MGGSYLVSGFSRDNFPELNAILRGPPFQYRKFPGHLPEEVRSAADEAGFVVEAWKEETLESSYPSPEDFLTAIKSLGSSRRPEAGQPLTRGKLQHLMRAYRESYPVGTGVRVTWKPWYALLRKAGRG